jgi:acyl carrier protein
LCPPTAIKISRTQLTRKIENGEVNLTTFADKKAQTMGGEQSPLTQKVKEIVADVLGVNIDTVDYTSHIFYDLGATSIQYFSIITRLSEEFSITDYKAGDKYCYTVKDICEYLEKCI